MNKKILVIAEKPSVASDIAKALGGMSREKDYFEGENYVVSSAVGHLLEMAVPEKSYRQQMEEAESKIILQAFRKYGSSSKVGEALGIGQTTAARKIRKYVGHE